MSENIRNSSLKNGVSKSKVHLLQFSLPRLLVVIICCSNIKEMVQLSLMINQQPPPWGPLHRNWATLSKYQWVVNKSFRRNVASGEISYQKVAKPDTIVCILRLIKCIKTTGPDLFGFCKLIYWGIHLLWILLFWMLIGLLAPTTKLYQMSIINLDNRLNCPVPLDADSQRIAVCHPHTLGVFPVCFFFPSFISMLNQVHTFKVRPTALRSHV